MATANVEIAATLATKTSYGTFTYEVGLQNGEVVTRKSPDGHWIKPVYGDEGLTAYLRRCSQLGYTVALTQERR